MRVNRKMLWQLELRKMGMVRSECKPFSEFIINEFTTEKETVSDIKLNHFSVEWWDETLILDVVYLGEIWYSQK